MKRLVVLGLVLSLLSPLRNTAQAGDCHRQTCLSAGVEYLYLQPSFYDPFFLIPEGGPGTTNEPRGTRFANLHDYHSGVRGWAQYDLCSLDQIGVYTEGMYSGDKHSRFLFIGTEGNPPLSLGTKGNPHNDLNSVENATSKIDYYLWNIKGGFTYSLCPCSPLMAMLHLNAHYANTKYQETLSYDETQNMVRINATAESWGAGPELGLDLSYHFFPCLALVVRGSSALLVVHHKATVCEIDTLTTPMDEVFANNDRRCTVQPYLELKVGLNGTACLSCCNINLELGFDVLRYSDIYDNIRWIGDRESAGGTGTEGASFDYFSPLMLQGLYASVGVSF